MHALSAVAAAGHGTSTASATGLRRSLAQHLLKKRPLLMGGGGGAGDAVLLPTSRSFHSSAPALGGGTPGEWNHVWNWKIKQRLATMKEEGDKLKNQSSSNSSSSGSSSGEGLGPLPGEKVIALDENLPDGALEAYWAQLRREREGQGGGGGGGGGGGEEKKEEGGKAKRKTIKKHFLFGWNYAPKKNRAGAAGAAGGKGGARLPNKPPAAAAAASAGGK